MQKMIEIVSTLEKSPKNTIFQHLILYNSGLRIFSEKPLSEFLDVMVHYLHAKKSRNSLERFGEKCH